MVIFALGPGLRLGSLMGMGGVDGEKGVAKV